MIELLGIIIFWIVLIMIGLLTLMINVGVYLFAGIYSIAIVVYMEGKFKISDIAMTGYFLLFMFILGVLSAYLQEKIRN